MADRRAAHGTQSFAALFGPIRAPAVRDGRDLTDLGFRSERHVHLEDAQRAVSAFMHNALVDIAVLAIDAGPQS